MPEPLGGPGAGVAFGVGVGVGGAFGVWVVVVLAGVGVGLGVAPGALPLVVAAPATATHLSSSLDALMHAERDPRALHDCNIAATPVLLFDMHTPHETL